MPTKAIQPGTVNTSINAPVEWRMAVGKAAFARDLSIGEFVKQCVERVLAYDEPMTAAEMRRVRRAMAATGTALILAGVALAAWASYHGRFHRHAPRIVDTVDSLYMGRVHR